MFDSDKHETGYAKARASKKAPEEVKFETLGLTKLALMSFWVKEKTSAYFGKKAIWELNSLLYELCIKKHGSCIYNHSEEGKFCGKMMMKGI